ncbi:D-alanyl-lipoteichoic acid biosynthesis protein DltD [Clostridium sardiniense]
MKKLLYFIIPVLIGVVFAFGLNKFLDNEINKLYQSKNLIPLKNQYSTNVKDKSVNLADHLLSEGDIMMMGSSELNHSVTRQHPNNYFNTNRSKNGIFTIGRPFTQTLQDSIMLGSTNPKIKDKKVVLLVSMQWFMDKGGVTRPHFQDRFSPAQFYAFLNNNTISKENKDEMAKRVSNLLKGSEEYKSEREYAILYNSDTTISKIEKIILYPYFKLREKVVNLKNKGILYRKLRKLPNKNKDDYELGKPINWKEEEKVALEQAEKRTKGNKFKVDFSYYNGFLKKEYKNLKNRYTKLNLMESEEFKDYQFFLNLCENLGVKPTIVVIPASNWYYNYTGIPKKERYEYYDKVTKMAEKKGFKVIDLKGKETTDYYLRDIMHLGTRGWLDVNEKLYKEYNEGQIFNK